MDFVFKDFFCCVYGDGVVGGNYRFFFYEEFDYADSRGLPDVVGIGFESEPENGDLLACEVPEGVLDFLAESGCGLYRGEQLLPVLSNISSLRFWHRFVI